PVVALADCGERGLLASTADGRLFRCRNREFVPFVLDVQPRDVDAFFLDRDGLLWMGTQGDGLWMEAGGRARQITVKDGLYDDEVYGIVADEEARLWMACSRGIFYVDRAELRRCAAGETAQVKSTPFSPTDALRTLECQSGVQPGLWRMQDGSNWYSTIHG